MENQGQIMEKLGNLEGITKEGFRGVHSRQDMANGRIEKLEGRVGTLEKEDVRSHGIQENATKLIQQEVDGKKVWTDRLWNALFIAGLTLIGWMLLATGILRPPV